MNWYIGQDVVCIDGDDFHKLGSVYTILELRGCTCRCGGVDLYVGQRCNTDIYENITDCADCGVSNIELDNKVWQHEDCFAPLDSLVNISELTEVLKQPVFN